MRMKGRIRGSLSGAIVALCALAAGPAAAQEGDGLYTEEQAVHGEELYMQYCASCHARNLRGGANEFAAPALTGPFFLSNWDGRTWEELFLYSQQYMPPGGPQLATAEYLDITAFIIQNSGHPAGDAALDLESPALELPVERAAD